jgi:S-adenosyl-L-methionine hydrolase (adenosine-forming)
LPPFITFLSDYGHDDDFVGVCHAVIAGIAPDARVIDIAHGIERHDVRTGALVLRNTLPYAPAGVHMAVVDPGVGAERRAVAVRCAEQDRVLVGPDNGLLALAWQRFGGAVEAVEIGRSPWRLEPVSATFHGRDIFAPVTARLAAGGVLAEAGEPLDVDALVGLDAPRPRVEGDALVVHVTGIDRFGNLVLNAGHEDLAGSGLRLGQQVELDFGEGDVVKAVFAVTFADVPSGGVLLYEDAYRSLALAVNRGSASRDLDLRRDHELRIRPA